MRQSLNINLSTDFSTLANSNCATLMLQFVEYDPRAHRLDTLASFSFWVSSRDFPFEVSSCSDFATV